MWILLHLRKHKEAINVTYTFLVCFECWPQHTSGRNDKQLLFQNGLSRIFSRKSLTAYTAVSHCWIFTPLMYQGSQDHSVLCHYQTQAQVKPHIHHLKSLHVCDLWTANWIRSQEAWIPSRAGQNSHFWFVKNFTISKFGFTLNQNKTKLF